MSDDSSIPTPAPADDPLTTQFRTLIPADAHPSTLVKATAFYHEIENRPFTEIALLLAYQQIMLEGMAQSLAKANEAPKPTIIKPNGRPYRRRF